jgi:TonB family protein
VVALFDEAARWAMRGVRSALAMAVFTTACLWAQQGQTPDPDNAKISMANPDTTPTLSAADKSLACPASLTPDDPPDGIDKPRESITPPKPLKQVNAEFSDESRKTFAKAHLKSFYAFSAIHLIVDKDGNPQDVCVQKAAGYGLDGQAVKAVKQYRFRPATKDGAPVSVPIHVQVDFRLYR